MSDEFYQHTLGDQEITAILFKGEPLWLIGHVERALGYHPGRLAEYVRDRSRWGREFKQDRDYYRFEREDLRVLKQFLASSQNGGMLHPQVRSCMALTRRGLELTLFKSEKPEAEAYRAELLDNVLPKLRELGWIPGQPLQIAHRDHKPDNLEPVAQGQHQAAAPTLDVAAVQRAETGLLGRGIERLDEAIDLLGQPTHDRRHAVAYELRLTYAELATGHNLSTYRGALDFDDEPTVERPTATARMIQACADMVDEAKPEPIEVVDARGPAGWYREYEEKIRAHLAHGGTKTRRQLFKAMRSMRAKKDRLNVVICDLIESGVLVEDKRNNGAWQLRLAAHPNGAS